MRSAKETRHGNTSGSSRAVGRSVVVTEVVRRPGEDLGKISQDFWGGRRVGPNARKRRARCVFATSRRCLNRPILILSAPRFPPTGPPTLFADASACPRTLAGFPRRRDESADHAWQPA